jgi:hypothetical protein
MSLIHNGPPAVISGCAGICARAGHRARLLRSVDVLGGVAAQADTLRYSRGSIRIAAEDFDAFFSDYIALLRRYARPREEAKGPARTILTRLLTFPAPDR